MTISGRNTEISQKDASILKVDDDSSNVLNQAREHNRMLEERIQKRTRELHELQHELIQRLLRAAEFRDDSTGSHILRIGRYSSELGRAAGLSEEFCKLLEQAAMMHDIGKIGIPDDILLKNDKLSAEEWEKMKTHSEKGAEILSGSSFEVLKLAERIALTHHEKWDGSGYPRGIKKDDIPIEGRIVAICDVFDALLSERPYKKEWSVEDAVREIEKGAGRHFDPLLTGMFLRNIDTFLGIRETYK